jgi:hypothetical protein
LRNALKIGSGIVALLCLILIAYFADRGQPAGRNTVSWELDGDRRNFFPAASIEKVTTSSHVVIVRSDSETFKVYCLDEEQALALADVLRTAMNKAGN